MRDKAPDCYVGGIPLLLSKEDESVDSTAAGITSCKHLCDEAHLH